MVGMSIGNEGTCRYRSGIDLESFEGATDFQGKLRFLPDRLGVGECVSAPGKKV
jgi:hypothetical protein